MIPALAPSRLALIALFCGVSLFSQAQETPSDVNSQVQYLITSSPAAARIGAEPVGNMGNLAFPVELEIPPSRSETQPDLQLIYNSANQRHGSFVGQSWSLDLGYIERSTQSGVPAYTADDDFRISLGKAVDDLVQVNALPDTIEFRTTREKLFLLIYFIPSANRWVVIDKKGTQYHFGETAGARISDGPDRVLRWALNRVFSPQFNHSTTYTYSQNNRQLYPERIDYFHGRVDFTYQAHPQPFRSFKAGFEIKTTRMLQEIRTFHRDTTTAGNFLPVSVYGLRYTKKQCGVDELDNIVCLTPYLESITRYNGSKTDSLPSTVFEYDDPSLDLAKAQINKWRVPLVAGAGFTEDDGDDNNALELVDVSGDGFPDLVQADGDDQHNTFLNNRENAWEESNRWVVPVIDNGGFTEDDGTGDNGVRLADVNNDGFLDIVQGDGDDQRATFLNNQFSGWSSSPNWQVPVIAGAGFTEDDGDGDNGVRLADVNNDGFVDIIQADGDDQRATFLNNQVDGWVTDPRWQVPVIAGGGFTEDDGEGDNGVRLADVNGDGFIDIIQADGDDQRATFLNNQVDGWVADTRWQVPVIAGAGFTEDDGDGDNGVRLADVDNDGFVDIIQGDGDDQRATFLNNQVDGWVADTRWRVPVIDNGGFTEDDGDGDNGVRLADVDNDGFVDIAVADGNDLQQHITYINNRTDGWVLVSLPVSRLDFETNWQVSSDWEVPIMDKGGFNEQNGEGNNGVRLADVNSDGFIDILHADGNDSDQHVTFLNNGKNGWELSPLWQIPVLDKGGFTEEDGGGDNALQITDLNSDGFPDLIQADGDNPAQHQAFLNDGKGGWELSPGWFIPLIDNGGFTESDGDGDNGLRIADVNGDGYPDIVQADGNAQRAVLLNDQISDWTITTLFEIPDINGAGFTEDGGDNDNGVRLIDVNGDGLVDIVQADDQEQRAVFLNQGDGTWFGETDWQIPVIHSAGFTEDGGDGDNGVRFADLNFDGFVDLIQGDGDDQRDVYLNNGSDGWVKVTSWQIPMIAQGGFTEDDGEGDNGLNISDVNGDGFPDLVQGDGLQERRTYLNAMTRPPLLNKIDNGIGGIIQIDYKTHTGKPVIYTVSEIRESDGFNANLSRFEFEGPFFDQEEQEFRGFGRSRSIVNGAVYESFYHQANGDDPATFEQGDSLGMEGYVYFTKISKEENPNFLFQARRNQWSLQVDRFTPEYHLVQLQTEINYDFASDGIFHTGQAKSYEYDSTGNVTRLTDFKYVEDGLMSGRFTDILPSDNVVTVTEYARDAAAPAEIRGFPSRIMAQDMNGAILRESRIFYDGLPLGQLSTGLPSMEQKLRVFTDLELYPRGFVDNTDPASPDHVPYMDTIATFVYDNRGNIVRRTNPNGDVKFYFYDPTGMYAVRDSIFLQKGKSDPVALVNRYKYDPRTGEQAETTAPNGAVSRKTFDDFGRILSLAESEPDDVSLVLTKQTYQYELFGASEGHTNNRIVNTLQKDGYDIIEKEITFVDGFFRTVQTKSLTTFFSNPDTAFTAFRTQCYTYNREGRVERSFQPYFTQGEFFTPIDFSLPHILTRFDPLGRLLGMQPVNMNEADSPMTGESREYTLEGPQHARIVRKGDRETRFVYNSGGQITDIYQKNGKEVYHTQYFYDVLDRLIRIRDQAGAVTTFSYDSMDEKREMDDPSTGRATYVYDGAGNILRYVDAKKDTTFFAYDELYRILSKLFSEDPAEAIHYTYDEDGYTGFLTTLESKNVVSTYRYNSLGKVVFHDRLIENKHYQLKPEYDPYGRMLSLTYPDAKTVEYEYFPSGALLKRVKMGNDVLATFNSYSALAKPVSYRYGNGVVTDNTFFASNERIKSTSVKSPTGTEIQGFSYRFDDFGNVRFVENRILQTQKSFGYDDLNRLVEWEIWEQGTPPGQEERFAYDAIGNILEKDGKEYVYEDERPYVLAEFDGQDFEHDLNGNQTVGLDGRKYTYDIMDRLVEVRSKNNKPVVNFRYDASNGRVMKITPSGGTTIYIDNLYEFSKKSSKVTKHIYANGQLIASMSTQGAKIQYYHHDHLGSITLITDGEGDVAGQFDYTPYGEQIVVSGSAQSSFGFTGQFADNDVGLVYYQSRYYDPVLGRFLQPDRYIPRPEDPQTLNRYTYVGNNPVTFVDPTGHWFGIDDLIAAGVGFAVGFTVALIASDFDFKVALAAGISNAVTFWFVYNTLGVGGVVFVASMQIASVISNEVFAGSKGGSIGDAIQLVTTFGASPIISTVGLVVGVSYILFTDRTWENDFHYVDGTLWFNDPFRGKDAMTTGAVVHYGGDEIFSEETIAHELIHRRQFGFSGDGFVIEYFAEIGIRMAFGQNQDDAYRSAIFEAEAYGKEGQHGQQGSQTAGEAYRMIQLFDMNVLVTAPGRF